MINSFNREKPEFMRYLLNLIYGVAIVLYSPKILYRMLCQDRYRRGWSQRLGQIMRRHPEKPCIWIHAVSMGEVNAARTLIERLKERLGDYEIAISSTTDTGLARAKALYDSQHTVFYFPFDLSWVMERSVRRIRPAVILLMELEVWPNLAAIAHSQNVPVVVVNGRLSDNSFPKYQKIRVFIRPMFRKVDLVLAQTEEYARRFIALGCDPGRVIVTNSLKYDTAQTEGAVAGAVRLAEQICLNGRRLWVAGGTGPGEEKMVLDAFLKLKNESDFEDLRLAIVPRKPERFEEVAALIEQAGLEYVRYSVLKEKDIAASNSPAVILGDTMGDLKKFYALATVVFVGRSLVPMGGSDMMESAALGKCTLFGPHTFNFKQTVEALLAGKGAIEVADENELYEKTRLCLEDGDFTRRIAANGQDVIRRNQGATQKTLEAVSRILSKA